MKRILRTEETETIELARNIAALLQPGMTLLLFGDLGAGKTTFTKGIGAGLGIERIIKSPTYTIVREYTEGRLPLYHIDLYRLEESEVIDLGLDEYFAGEGVSVVEWPTVAPDDLPTEVLEVHLTRDGENLNHRRIELRAKGEQCEELLEKLASN